VALGGALREISVVNSVPFQPTAGLSAEAPLAKKIDVILRNDCDAGSRLKKFFRISDEQIHQDGLALWTAGIISALDHTT
jgi:hypothetical protein